MMKSSSVLLFFAFAFAISIFFLLIFLLKAGICFHSSFYCSPCLSGLSLVFSVQKYVVLVCVFIACTHVCSTIGAKKEAMK